MAEILSTISDLPNAMADSSLADSGKRSNVVFMVDDNNLPSPETVRATAEQIIAKAVALSSAASLQYGGTLLTATGVGTTDTAALEAAVTAAQAGNKIILLDTSAAPLVLDQGGDILMHDVVLRGLGAQANVRLSNNTSLSFGEYYSPTVQTSWEDFTVDASKSVVSIPTMTGAVVGDCLLLSSTDAIDCGTHFDGGTTYPGEIAEIVRISGSDYYLSEPLVDTYTTTPKAALLSRTNASGSVKKLSVRCGLDNISFAGSNNSAGANPAYAAKYYCCYRPFNRNVTLSYSGGIALFLCYAYDNQAIIHEGAVNANTDYGIVPAWSDCGVTSGYVGRSSRHHYTTSAYGSGTTRWATNKHNVFENFLVSLDGDDTASSSNIGIDTHAESYGFICRSGLVVMGSEGTISPSAGPTIIAYQSRGRKSRFQDCIAVGNEAGKQRGFHTSGAQDTEIINCVVDGAWCGIHVEIQGSTVKKPSNGTKVVGGLYRNIRNDAMIFDSGDDHMVYGAKIESCGKVAGGLFGSVRACISFYDRYALGMTGCGVIACDLTKDTNLYSVATHTLAYDDLNIQDNRVGGYGFLSIGLDRSLSETPKIEQNFGNLQVGRKNNIYLNQASHGRSVSDVNKPYTDALALYDDTASGQIVLGFVADVINTDWLILEPIGTVTTMLDSQLTTSYTYGTDSRKLYYDASAGKYAKTKPGDSHASVDYLCFVTGYYDGILHVVLGRNAV